MPKTNRVAAVGVGYSTTGRGTGLTFRQLALQAGKAAMADAGMTPKDIDGVAVVAGVPGPTPPGLDSIGAMDAASMFGFMPVHWFWDGGPVYVSAAMQAYAAITSGFAHTVITFRVVKQALSTRVLVAGEGAGVTPADVRGDQQFTQPFGDLMPLQAIAALPARRHMAEYGTTEEQFGAHVIAQRYHASLNDDAIFRDPLTMEDYLNARYVSKPVRLLDCDYPVDSGSAIIYTTEERAHDWKKPPVWVDSAAYCAVHGGGFELLDDMLHGAPDECAKEMWAKTDLKPSDVDCAQLYDGFTIITFRWLEALGFCKPGESGPFVEAGNTRLGGSLPVNTDGGACNVGRRHGSNFCIETVRQLRGESDIRQVPDAKVGVWANAVGPFGGVMLMTGD